MRLGMLGLGRMGSSMIRRLITAGHECVVYDVNPEPGKALERDGAVRAASANLRYVAGDCQDPATFDHLREALGEAAQPLHYLAVPPPLFPTVAVGLSKSGCAKNARVVVRG
jgi:glucose-6-phosphate 1-dehydrogenase